MARACWIAGLLLIWVSVGVITIGTHLQTQSPRFGEFRQAEIARLNPAGRMALMLSFTWQFACCFSGFFALLFTVGGLCVRVAKRWHRELALVVAGAFGMGCLAGAVIGWARRCGASLGGSPPSVSGPCCRRPGRGVVVGSTEPSRGRMIAYRW